MLTLAWGRGKWAFSQKRLMIQNLCILYILFTRNTCEYFFYDIVTLVHIIFITIKLYYIVKRTTSNRVILTIALKNNIIHGKQFNHPISLKKKKHYSTFLLSNIISTSWKTFQDKWTYFYGLCNCWIIGFKKL